MSINDLMPAHVRVRRRLRLLMLSEQGMALPTALLATVISFSLASAAVFASVNSQQGTTRDYNSKEAIAAADAGAGIAQLRMNRYGSSLTSSKPCLGVSGSTLVTTTVSGDGWCPAITGSVGGATYSYRVTPQVSGGAVNVIATGASGGVNRRIDVAFTSTPAGGVLGTEGVIGLEEILLEGSNATIESSIGSNGFVNANGHPTVCGNIRHGVGKTSTSPPKQCSGYTVTEGNTTLPLVSTFIPSNIATENSDYRLVTCTAPNVPAGCELDTYAGTRSATTPWNAATRSLSFSGTLTLKGGDYFICSLTLAGNSHLIMASGAHIRIFFNTPEQCGPSSPATQLSLTGNSNIEATNFKPGLSETDLPALYFLGSSTTTTNINIEGNASSNNDFLIYAPNTEIRIAGNGTYNGIVAGKKVTVAGNGTIIRPKGYEPPQMGGAVLYSRQSYVECSGVVTAPPNAGC